VEFRRSIVVAMTYVCRLSYSERTERRTTSEERLFVGRFWSGGVDNLRIEVSHELPQLKGEPGLGDALT
jgi:hypothetical protein